MGSTVNRAQQLASGVSWNRWHSLGLLVIGLVLFSEIKPVSNSLQLPTAPMDSFQDWASARNYRTGLPIYTSHRVTWPLYADEPLLVPDRHVIERNGHPPASVLLLLPLGWLEYPYAHLAWNLTSLAAIGLGSWLVVRYLGLTRWPLWLPVMATLLLGYPLQQQLRWSNWSALLGLLVTLTWLADRSARPATAGILAGLATAL